MNGQKTDKKITLSKNIQPKKEKLQLQIQLPPDSEMPRKPPATTLLPSPNVQITAFKSVSTLSSPKNPVNENFESDITGLNSSKKGYKDPIIQKKGSNKQPVRVDLPKTSIQLNSPKSNIPGKGLTTYTSEKNLLVSKPQSKKQQPAINSKDGSAQKIQELQKQIEQMNGKEQQMTKSLQQFRRQNEELKIENQQLKKKIEKIKLSNEQTKKMLKQRINSFNQEGEQLKTLRLQIKTLEGRVQNLLEENTKLKAQINKYSDYNVRTSEPTFLKNDSKVVQSYFQPSDGSSLLEFKGLDNVEYNLELDGYISQSQASCIEQYKNNLDIFDAIRNEYEQILKDIQTRYRTLIDEERTKVKQQAKQIEQLQNENAELIGRVSVAERDLSQKEIKLGLQTEIVVLRRFQDMAQLNVRIFDLDSRNRELAEEVERYRLHGKFMQAQVDIERMKKRFMNQNDKFQFNVVKLNLLNIIDRLKMQIDIQKSKREQLKEII